MTVSVKSLQKQLVAAVAMVLVAAVALSSSTYAWFVSNNTVKATTSTISAQSNSPFLMIDKANITTSSGTAISFTDIANKALYPAQVVKHTDDTPLFKSAYASASNKADVLTGSRYDVGNAEAAVTGEFAIKESFKIGTADAKAGSFKNLKVSKVELTSAGTDGLEAALSILVVCGDNWAVYKANADGTVLAEYKDGVSAVGNNTGGVLADTIAANTSVDVDVYVFYDGSETNVYTDNLANLTAIGATISFSATPVNTQGTAVDAGNIANNAAATASFASNTLNLNVTNVPTGYTASYSWSKDGTVVSGANAETYTLTDASQNGNYICTITYTKAGSPSFTVVSNAVAATYNN